MQLSMLVGSCSNFGLDCGSNLQQLSITWMRVILWLNQGKNILIDKVYIQQSFNSWGMKIKWERAEQSSCYDVDLLQFVHVNSRNPEIAWMAVHLNACTLPRKRSAIAISTAIGCWIIANCKYFIQENTKWPNVIPESTQSWAGQKDHHIFSAVCAQQQKRYK